jgi:hypothetical protein
MRLLIAIALALGVASSANAQYLGRLSSNPYDADSTSNKFGRYGSPYSSDSINNPYSKWGSPYSNQSVNNPYATRAPRVYGDGSIYGND